MIDRLARLARRLRPLRLAFLVITGLGLAGMALTLLTGADRGDALLRLAIAASLWGGLLLAFVDLFREVPRPTQAGDRLLLRMGLKLRRFGYLLLGLVVAFATLLLLSMSLRLAFVA